MTDPFLITGPATISFSGGRTSAYMLKRILEAHRGRLPDDVVVTFANTGKERPETLRFVYDCGRRWNVKIHWVEWQEDGGFREVGYNSASRNGEPFAALIKWKSRLPNWRERWCTQHMKVQAMSDFLRATRGWEQGTYREVVGLRADEPWRLVKMKGRNIDHGRRCMAPLADAGITKQDVLTFWLGSIQDPKNVIDPPQGFELGLQVWEGNCDLCFLKGEVFKRRILRDQPDLATWWIGQETPERGSGMRGWFSSRHRIEDLLQKVESSPELFDTLAVETVEEEQDAECGLFCGPADEEAA